MQLDSIILPDELEWVDEVSWSPIEQKLDYSVTGSLLIQSSEKQAGRYITLQGKPESGWIDRPTLESLLTLRDSNATMTLLLSDGRSFSVKFRYSDTPIEVVSVRGYDNFNTNALYTVGTIKLMEV